MLTILNVNANWINWSVKLSLGLKILQREKVTLFLPPCPSEKKSSANRVNAESYSIFIIVLSPLLLFT